MSLRKYKVTKWEIQSVSVGYETIVEADFEEDTEQGDWEGIAIEKAEKKGYWDKIHDEVLKTNVTEYDVISGYIETHEEENSPS